MPFKKRKQRLSVVLDRIAAEEHKTFWQNKLTELKLLLRKKRYIALERQIDNLMDCKYVKEPKRDG